MNNRIGLFFFALLICFAQTNAQRYKNSISGQILDAANNPVYYANIFLANTTLGTTSNAEGHYHFGNIPPGSYTLVVSYMGYETITQKVLVNVTGKMLFNFVLQPTVLEMETVQIDRARDRTWRHYFKVFEQEFLGYSDNAKGCTFENPEVLHLIRDETSGTLSGQTIQPLELRHENLGYRVKLIVRSFQVTDDQINYTVLPSFQEMTPTSEKQAATWEENRRNAFYGSYRHFFNALFNQRFSEAGFSLERVEDAKRFRTADAVYDSQSAAGKVFSRTDYGLIKRLHFEDYLRIRYNENWAQTSFLHLPFDTIEVDVAGNALSDFQIIRSGHWGETRFADELPLDYVPK
jgi:hypothetical protein